MNEEIKKIIDALKSAECISDEDKTSIEKSAKLVDKELTVTAFKLERTEKVKRTTGILLEETIEELEQKRKAVEEQNRELEIAAGLERVRAVAMGMDKPDDLMNICEISFKEFLKLGFTDIRNAVIHIPNDEQQYFMDYDYSEFTGGQVAKVEYGSHPIVDEYLEKIYSAKDEFFEVVINEDQLAEWNRFRLESGQSKDTRLDNATALYYYLFSIGMGDIGISTFAPISVSQREILKRFRNVFDLAYRRYNDIAKAEKQAREAQIEAALEKIRNRTLIMKDSSELNETVAVFFKQFKELNLLPKNVRTYFSQVNSLIDIVEVWMTHSDGSVMKGSHKTPITKSPELNEFYEKWKINKDILNVRTYKGNALRDYMNFLSSLPHVAEDKDYLSLFKSPPEQIVMTDAGFQYGFLGVMSFVELESESIDVLKRFAKVFEFTFTRFLDLKKAEAQAREAQIEAALERVRARTMAMHKSNELAQTAAHLFSQLNELGIKPYRCNIAIVDNESESCCQLWSTTNSGNVIPTSSYMPLDKYEILTEMYNGWREQKSTQTVILKDETRRSWNEYILKYAQFKDSSSNDLKEVSTANEPAVLSNFNFKQGFFIIHTNKKLSDNELKIINRFSKVFEQTYTRYLDLEKAEKQNKLIQAENERKSQELEEARQLQLAMLPREIPELAKLEIAVYMKTATEVGGDYYDFHVSEEGTLTAVIGDATGHGMKAGTMVTITKSLFNTFASGKDLLKTFKRISQVIKDMKFRQLSMCLQMVKIDNYEFSFSSAAMPPLFIYHSDKKSVEEILLSGMPLGAIVNYQYKIENRKLEPGDVIFMISDGLPELLNGEHKMYGYEKIREELKSVGLRSPEQIINHFENSALNWLNGSEADDDLTFVVIKIK